MKKRLFTLMGFILLIPFSSRAACAMAEERDKAIHLGQNKPLNPNGGHTNNPSHLKMSVRRDTAQRRQAARQRRFSSIPVVQQRVGRQQRRCSNPVGRTLSALDETLETMTQQQPDPVQTAHQYFRNHGHLPPGFDVSLMPSWMQADLGIQRVDCGVAAAYGHAQLIQGTERALLATRDTLSTLWVRWLQEVQTQYGPPTPMNEGVYQQALQNRRQDWFTDHSLAEDGGAKHQTTPMLGGVDLTSLSITDDTQVAHPVVSRWSTDESLATATDTYAPLWHTVERQLPQGTSKGLSTFIKRGVITMAQAHHTHLMQKSLRKPQPMR